uniref:Reverse transcriptase domain-containing protein n=1 Tax=Mycena chlorophos TaxID=658473 RepID=A0ABQ0LPW4_MYCCL|nr:predicted protein [Mycena chlorophos]
MAVDPAQMERATVSALHGTVALAAISAPTAPPASTGARCAALATGTTRSAAPLSNFLPVLTPLLPDSWERRLRAAGLLEDFGDVPRGLRDGFDFGIRSFLTHTFIPPNHRSALEHPEVIMAYIRAELAAGHYSGPFHPSRLQNIIGFFRSSPLGVVPKAGSLDEWRIIQDFSFPRNDPTRSSVNAEIDSDDFPCEWGTFSEVVLMVLDAPPGTEAATLDVDAAFRRVPIHPSQQPHFVVVWDNLCYLDHVAPFGPASSPGIFGRLADAMKALYLANDIGPLKKWVDDFLFLRFPISYNPTRFAYGLDEIYALAEDLGWPWKPSKTRPFDPVFKYLGFIWDLGAKTVAIPEAKRLRYIRKLEDWVEGAKFSRKEAESVLGTLVHCSLAVPDGRSRLPAISKFASAFSPAKPFSKHTLTATVVEDIAWWRGQLASSFCGSTLVRPPTISGVEFFVDASTSYGIGVVFDGVWDAWHLCPGWDAEGRDIGWAEMVAIELGLLVAVARGFSEVHLHLHSDNQGVIGALDGGKSRNSEQNRVLRRIVSILRAHSIWITTSYIPSALNAADRPSRGLAPIPERPRSFATVDVPFCLRGLVARV